MPNASKRSPMLKINVRNKRKLFRKIHNKNRENDKSCTTSDWKFIVYVTQLFNTDSSALEINTANYKEYVCKNGDIIVISTRHKPVLVAPVT